MFTTPTLPFPFILHRNKLLKAGQWDRQLEDRVTCQKFPFPLTRIPLSKCNLQLFLTPQHKRHPHHNLRRAPIISNIGTKRDDRPLVRIRQPSTGSRLAVGRPIHKAERPTPLARPKACLYSCYIGTILSKSSEKNPNPVLMPCFWHRQGCQRKTIPPSSAAKTTVSKAAQRVGGGVRGNPDTDADADVDVPNGVRCQTFSLPRMSLSQFRDFIGWRGDRVCLRCSNSPSRFLVAE